MGGRGWRRNKQESRRETKGGAGYNRRMGGGDKNWTNVGNLGEFCFFWLFSGSRGAILDGNVTSTFAKGEYR